MIYNKYPFSFSSDVHTLRWRTIEQNKISIQIEWLDGKVGEIVDALALPN